MSDTPPRPPRRDPRAERAARQGDAPAVLPAMPPPESAPTRTRRDPRAERAARTSGAATQNVVAPATSPPAATPGRARCDPRAERAARAAGQGSEPVAAEAAGAIVSGPRRVIADPACLVLAVPDLADGRLSPHDRDVIGGARALADAAGGAVLVLAFAAGEDFAAAGADRLALVPAHDPETRAAVLLAAVRAMQPRHLVLPDTLPGGGDLGRRVAAALGERAATGVVHLVAGRLVRRMVGGAHEAAFAPPRMVLLAPEAADPPEGPPAEARAVNLPVPELGTPRAADRGRVAVDANAIPLAEADFIVSAGNGVTDWPAFHGVAAALGATEGASRVICDAGLMPRERQVGASGTLVEPRCYLAFGIAGATQHLQGIVRCERVVAVNTDLHADMIKRADLAVVADAQAVMPALATLAEAKRRGA